MDFKNERLMMSKEEARNRAKELLNENQVDLITKYMFLEQQCKKQKEVIDKAMIELDTIINDLEKHGDEAPAPSKEELCKIFNILNEVTNNE